MLCIKDTWKRRALHARWVFTGQIPQPQDEAVSAEGVQFGGSKDLYSRLTVEICQLLALP